MTNREVLSVVTFGERVAELEADRLASYFVETDSWNRLFSGQVDVVYGPKGSGKSALYALLAQRSDQLFDRQVLLVPAENPRGAPAFKDLKTDPPASEPEFIALWKLYFLSLISDALDEYGIKSKETEEISVALQQEGLKKGKNSLGTLLSSVLRYVRSWFAAPGSVEGTAKFDPSTGQQAYTGKISFRELAGSGTSAPVSVDRLLELANIGLADAGFSIWLTIDRLDVAFSDAQELEVRALRALFRVYLDLAAWDHIDLKIFLRDDIWRRITESGFREASHVTKQLTIRWDRSSFLHLIASRAIENVAIRKMFGVNKEEVLDSGASKESFFYRVFPRKVDEGKNPETLDWIIGRTQDATEKPAPREVIHLLNAARDAEIRRLELGAPEPGEELLISRAAIKEALKEVSVTRLEQTIFAEYSALKPCLEELRGGRTTQFPSSLARIWGVNEDEARTRAQALVEIGFFQQSGPKDRPEYWVPWLYRSGLEMIQGAAES